jgi:hypothetical protein
VVRDLVAAHRGSVGYDVSDNAFVITLPPRGERGGDVVASGQPTTTRDGMRAPTRSRPLHDPDPLRAEAGEHAGGGRPEA